MQNSFEIKFESDALRCGLFLNDLSDGALFLALLISLNLTYSAPLLVVATSCVISVVMLMRKNKTIQQQHRALQQSRNRATVSILLFALVYVLCNIPYDCHLFFSTIFIRTGNLEWLVSLYEFDTQAYYQNLMNILLPAGNSAANPLLYFWRMPLIRNIIKLTISRLLREIRRLAKNVQQLVEEGSANRAIWNNNVLCDPPVAASQETRL